MEHKTIKVDMLPNQLFPAFRETLKLVLEKPSGRYFYTHHDVGYFTYKYDHDNVPSVIKEEETCRQSDSRRTLFDIEKHLEEKSFMLLEKENIIIRTKDVEETTYQTQQGFFVIGVTPNQPNWEYLTSLFVGDVLIPRKLTEHPGDLNLTVVDRVCIQEHPDDKEGTVIIYLKETPSAPFKE